VDCLLSFGFAAFLPKIFISYFSISYSLAATITGAVTIFGAAFGQLAGGFIITKFKLSVKGIIKLNIFLTVASIAPLLIFLVPCGNQEFAGFNTPYPEANKIEFASNCYSNCSCQDKTFEPICGSDRITYYSPCHAGCDDNLNGVFNSCSCITNGSTATLGICSMTSNCIQGHYWSLGGLFLFWAFCSFATVSPSIQVAMRVVPFEQRTLAVSLQVLLIRLFGTLPGPVLFGFLIDGACLINDKLCGLLGSCLILDNDTLRNKLFILSFSLKICSLILAVSVLFFHRPIKEEFTKDEELVELTNQNKENNNISGS